MEKKSIKDCGIQELKSMAYDRIVVIEKAKHELSIIQNELENREQSSKTVPVASPEPSIIQHDATNPRV